MSVNGRRKQRNPRLMDAGFPGAVELAIGTYGACHFSSAATVRRGVCLSPVLMEGRHPDCEDHEMR